MKAKLLLALLPAVCLCGPAYLTYAQLSTNEAITPIATGRIVGVLKDPSGAVVPGARIEVTNLALKVRKTLVTNLAGRFTFNKLPAGLYQATVTANGFDTAILRDISVVAGAETAANVTLKIARVKTVVEVNALETETASATRRSVSGSEQARSRNAAEIVAEAPGVSLR
jgi:hypothetical protein